MKSIFPYFLISLLIPVLFLFSPVPKKGESYWGEYVSINEHMGFIYNYDSNPFVDAAGDPSLVFTEKFTRQSRPLYIFLGAALGRTLYGLVAMTDADADQWSYYWAYVLINYVLMLSTIWLLRKIFIHIGVSDRWLLLAGVSLFFINDIIKAFFWTAHQQMFILFTPVLLLWLAIKSQDQVKLSRLFLYSFLLGFGMLIYGNFIIAPLVLYGVYCHKKSVWKHLHILVGFTIVLFIPLLLWMLILKVNGLDLYMLESDRYRQLVWMLDSLQGGTFLHDLGVNLVAFFSRFLHYDILPFIILAVVAIPLALRKLNNERIRILIKYALIIFMSYFVFYALLGYYSWRMNFNFVVLSLLIVLSVWLLWPVSKRLKLIGLSVLVIGSVLFHVLHYGPFS